MNYRPRRCLLSAFVVIVAGLILGARVMAQTVALTNPTPWGWSGWIRTTVEVQPPHRAGYITPCGKMDGDCCVKWVLGRQLSPGLWFVDIHCTLQPGQTRTIKFGETITNPETGRKVAGPMAFPVPQGPADPLAFYGGWPSINGVGMQFVKFEAEPPPPRVDPSNPTPEELAREARAIHCGNSFCTKWRASIGKMLVVDLWLRNNGTSQPGLAFGEVSVTCSNPAVPDVTETAPAIYLTIGSPLDALDPNKSAAIIWPLGGAPWEIVPAGTTFADGMTRTVPVTLTWLRHLGPLPERAGDWLSALVAVNGGIVARGAKPWRAQ